MNRREWSNFTFIVLILLSRIKKMKKSKNLIGDGLISCRVMIGMCRS